VRAAERAKLKKLLKVKPMHCAVIPVPSKTDLRTMFEFARDLDYFAMHDRLTFDFGEPRFHSPFSMLFLAAKLKSFRLKNPDLEIHFIRHQAHSYAAHMGFFRMLDVDQSQAVINHSGNEDYLPITCLDRASFYVSEGDRFVELPDLIQRHADQIARVITREDRQHADMFDVLSYSIREVMRNVFEHSRADFLFYCAQYWPRSNKVEFAIADFGVGIRHALSENPNFRFKTDKEALSSQVV